jgi:hypothetical protein
MSLVFFQAWAQNNAAPSAEEEIRSLEQERNVAILNGDAAALERMTADDYTFVTLRGELRTKSEIVKGFQSGSFKYEAVSFQSFLATIPQPEVIVEMLDGILESKAILFRLGQFNASSERSQFGFPLLLEHQGFGPSLATMPLFLFVLQPAAIPPAFLVGNLHALGFSGIQKLPATVDLDGADDANFAVAIGRIIRFSDAKRTNG